MLTWGAVLYKECLDYWGRVTIYIFTRLKKQTGKRNQHTSVCVWCESVSERCCVDQTSLTLFSPNKGFLIGSLWRETFPNHSDYCFIPLHSLPSFFFFFNPLHPRHYPYPPPHHIPTLQALEGAPSDQLMQQSQMPQYYAQQPWVPKTSASSLSHPSQLSLCAASCVTSFSHLHHHTWPPFISLHQCLLSLIAGVSSLRGALFSHFIPTTS